YADLRGFTRIRPRPASEPGSALASSFKGFSASWGGWALGHVLALGRSAYIRAIRASPWQKLPLHDPRPERQPRVRPRLIAGGRGGPLAADFRGTASMQPMRLDNASLSPIQLRSLQAPPPPVAESANAPALQPLQGRHEPAYHPQLAALT